MIIRELSFLTTGIEVKKLLSPLEGELIHRISIFEHENKERELNIYQKRYKQFLPPESDFFITYQFSFLDPPYNISAKEISRNLKIYPPKGIFFCFDPTKNVSEYLKKIEHLFNLFYEYQNINPENPYKDLFIFAIVFVNFEALNFNHLAANKFLQELYPTLFKHTKNFPNCIFLDAIITPEVQPLVEVRRLLELSINNLDRFDIANIKEKIAQEAYEKIISVINEAKRGRIPEIPVRAFQRDVSVSTRWITNVLRTMIVEQKLEGYSLLGTSLISTDSTYLKKEVDEIEEEIKYYQRHPPSGSGLLSYLLFRTQDLKNLIYTKLTQSGSIGHEDLSLLYNRIQKLEGFLKEMVSSYS